MRRFRMPLRESQLRLPRSWRSEARRFTLLAHQGLHDTTLKSKWGLNFTWLLAFIERTQDFLTEG